MFVGQGSQYAGMGKKLYDRYEIVKKIYVAASDILKFSVSDLLFEKDGQELMQTKNAQLATFILSYATYQAYLEKFEKVPMALCGHSLGEITALTCSNVIQFNDALKIIEKRGELMSDVRKIKKGRMLAVQNESVEFLENLCASINKCDKFITIANYNSNKQIILSGEDDAIEMAQEQLKGKIAIPLHVSGAFHSEMMTPIANDFYEYLNSFEYFSPMIPIVSSVDGIVYDDVMNVPEHLQVQLTKPVLWTTVMNVIKELEPTTAIEIGPKEVLAKFMQENANVVSTRFADSILLK